MPLHLTIESLQGDIAYATVDSLSAFWPGLQVLAGDVENAIKSHMTCENYKFSGSTNPPRTNTK